MAVNMTLIDGTLTEDAQRRGENGPLALNLKHEGKLITPRNGGEAFTKSLYMNVTLWGNLRDEFGSLREGDTVLVQGELEWNSYETDDGEKKGGLQLNGTMVTRLSGSEPAPQQPAAPAQQATNAAPPAADDIPF
jgi:single-stranded DNA-binding protein